MAPWARACSIPLKEVTFSLLVTRRNKQPTDELISDYQKLFEEKTIDKSDSPAYDWTQEAEHLGIPTLFGLNYGSRNTGMRILVEGDYGSGKSTLAKKIAYDWATKNFVTFRLVIYISLRLVNPTESIEKIIIFSSEYWSRHSVDY